MALGQTERESGHYWDLGCSKKTKNLLYGIQYKHNFLFQISKINYICSKVPVRDVDDSSFLDILTIDTIASFFF